MAERPTGAVTFLFTDVEGSTVAWENDPTGTAADLEVQTWCCKRRSRPMEGCPCASPNCHRQSLMAHRVLVAERSFRVSKPWQQMNLGGNKCQHGEISVWISHNSERH